MLIAACGTQPQQKPEDRTQQNQPIQQEANQLANRIEDIDWEKNFMDMMNKPATRASMIKAMSNPESRQMMKDIMADPAMKATLKDIVRDPRIRPTVKEAIK